MTKKRAFLLYLPVLHQGHWRLFEKFEQIDTLFLIDPDILPREFPVHKDIHALSGEQMVQLLSRWGRFEQVAIINHQNKDEIRSWQLVVPDDEAVLAWLAGENFPVSQMEIEPIFLRWTRKKCEQENIVTPNKNATFDDKNLTEMMVWAQAVGERSSDWWRRVGAVLQLTSGEVLVAHNQHLPESETPNMVGDVRAQFHRGDHWELTSAIHAEAYVLAKAARAGKSTDRSVLFVTDFPCPNCARLIAAAGVKTVYFARGYSVLDGAEILRGVGVDIMRVA
ncbi:hypothetical protein IJJ12_03925 [bacterium]|nr:hypothetical protein [bacterium]